MGKRGETVCGQSADAKAQPGSAPAPGGKERLIDVYRRWFDVVPADTPELLERAHRLRYQVYCVENPFEDPATNAGGLEKDEFDAHSVHSLLIHRTTGLVAGAVRIVLPLAGDLRKSFALQGVCRDPSVFDPARFPVERVGEVSRFSISKEFRKRREDARYPAFYGPAGTGSNHDERRIIPHMTLGLIEALVRMSVRHGVTHWCAVMEPQLLRLLTRLGIHFQNIGPLVDYHGLRQPCIAPLEILLPRVQQERPDVWEVLTNDGEHWDAFRDMLAGRRVASHASRMAHAS
ncbi:MAG: PEP-CTERM/exosortase system-associated acyltransferase [Alphaproteobacteria bacterium]